VDLPQPVRPEHPSSRTRVTCDVENPTRDAHAVTWALSNESARRTTRQARRTERVATTVPSRKKHDCERHPGCLPPSSAPALINNIAGEACQVPGRIPLPARRCLLVLCVFAALTCREPLGAGRVMTGRTGRPALGRDRSNLCGFCVWYRSAGWCPVQSPAGIRRLERSYRRSHL
jgi:hypothetical protein